MINEIVDEDEFGIDTDCDESCEFDDFDEEAYEDTSKKKKTNASENYLKTLRSYFDNVEVSIKPFHKQIPDLIASIGSVSAHEYYDVVCQDLVPKENKNPYIKYMTWVNLKIRNDHDFYGTMLKYIVENYALLVKDEDMSFFKRSDLSSDEGGINYYLLYEDRKNNPIPPLDELIQKQKEIMKYVFKNGMYEENNPRIGNFDEYDLSHYALEKSGLSKYIEEQGGALNDIELNRILGMRLHFGIPIKDKYQKGEESLTYPYWVDINYWVRTFGKIEDSSNCSTYVFKETRAKEFTAWLRDFTGIPKKEFNSVDEEVRQEIFEIFFRHYTLDEDSLKKIAKSCKDAKSFKKEIIGDKPDANGGGCTGDILSTFYDRTKKGLKLSITAYKDMTEFIGWDLDEYAKDDDSDKIVLFDKDMYEYIYNYYNPPIEALDLFSMMPDDNIKDEVADKANNESYSGPIQLSFF